MKITILPFILVMLVFSQIIAQSNSNAEKIDILEAVIKDHDSRLDSIDQLYEKLSESNSKLLLERDYFETILQDTTQRYLFVLTAILALLGIISFSYFTRKTQQLNDALKLFNEQELRITTLIDEQKVDRKKAYYNYGGLYDILQYLNGLPEFGQYPTSFSNSIQTVKYFHLAKPEKVDIIKQKLDICLITLSKIDKINRDTKYTRLSDQNIIEIRETLLALLKNENVEIKQKCEKISRLFENNLDKLK